MQTKNVFTGLTLLILSLLVPFQGFSAGKQEPLPAPGLKNFPRGHTLISVQELKSLIDKKDGNLVVIAAENVATFALGHIPGALLVDRPAYAADPATQNGVSGNILAETEFTQFARSLGISETSKIVVYDDDYDASRLWWAFTYYGHKNVRVLDGNIGTWKDAGYPVDLLGQREVTPGTFTAKIALPKLRLDTDELATLLTSDKVQVWDTRDLEEFTGEAQRSGAVRAGRVPGAKFHTWKDFKTAENKAVYKSYDEIKAQLDALGYSQDKDQIFYCQSGVRSTQAIFALYLAGWPLEKLRNYDSSWIGWSRSSQPLVTGPGN